MTNTIKALSTAIAALAIAGTAAASDNDESTIAFSYNANDAAERIYDDFMETATDACRGVGHAYIGVWKTRVRNACRDDLVERAVAATQSPRLISYFEQRNGKTIALTQYASLD